MGNYSFFKDLKVTDPGRVRTPKTRQPEGLALRLFNTGEVYPSQDLVIKFNLEFTNEANPDPGNGFDIVDTQHWKPLAEHPRMVMLGVTPKNEGKVDLFASVRHDENGEPKSSVYTRGEPSDTLLNLAKELGWLKDEQKYVDLKVVVEYPFSTTDGIAYIPKIIERGERKGERDYRRRDNITFYPVEMVETDPAALETVKETTITI